MVLADWATRYPQATVLAPQGRIERVVPELKQLSNVAFYSPRDPAPQLAPHLHVHVWRGLREALSGPKGKRGTYEGNLMYHPASGILFQGSHALSVGSRGMGFLARKLMPLKPGALGRFGGVRTKGPSRDIWSVDKFLEGYNFIMETPWTRFVDFHMPPGCILDNTEEVRAQLKEQFAPVVERDERLICIKPLGIPEGFVGAKHDKASYAVIPQEWWNKTDEELYPLSEPAPPSNDTGTTKDTSAGKGKPKGKKGKKGKNGASK